MEFSLKNCAVIGIVNVVIINSLLSPSLSPLFSAPHDLLTKMRLFQYYSQAASWNRHRNLKILRVDIQCRI